MSSGYAFNVGGARRYATRAPTSHKPKPASPPPRATSQPSMPNTSAAASPARSLLRYSGASWPSSQGPSAPSGTSRHLPRWPGGCTSGSCRSCRACAQALRRTARRRFLRAPSLLTPTMSLAMARLPQTPSSAMRKQPLCTPRPSLPPSTPPSASLPLRPWLCSQPPSHRQMRVQPYQGLRPPSVPPSQRLPVCKPQSLVQLTATCCRGRPPLPQTTTHPHHGSPPPPALGWKSRAPSRARLLLLSLLALTPIIPGSPLAGSLRIRPSRPVCVLLFLLWI